MRINGWHDRLVAISKSVRQMDTGKADESKMKPSLDDSPNSMAIQSFFSTYVLLDLLLSDGFVAKAESFHKIIGDTHTQEGLRQGYKLLLVVILDRYIDWVVRSPELIGIKPDLDYRDYYAFTKGRGREVNRSAARTDHEISRFVAKGNSLIAEILKLASWEDIRSFGHTTKPFRNCLRRVSEKGYEASRSSSPIKMNDALADSAAFVLWSTYSNRLPVAHMYTDYFTSSDRDVLPDGRAIRSLVRDSQFSSGMTRFDSPSFDRAFFPKTLPAHWALGYSFSFHENLKMSVGDETQRALLGALDDLVAGIRSWPDFDLYDEKTTVVLGTLNRSAGYTYAIFQSVTDDDRKQLMAEVEERPSPERLLSIFGNKARMVERGYPGALGPLECLLDGAIKRSRRTKENTKVAIIVHKEGGEEEDYSVAIFMPAYGLFTNGSMWWVFYSIGNNHSGSTSAMMVRVVSKLRRNRKSLDITVMESGKQEFYRFCEDPGYSRLNDAIVLTNKITAEVRGVFPELLLSNMLVNTGYTKVLSRIRPKILKSVKGELDTVGLKLIDNRLSKIILFESKGQATNESELQDEINRFSDNVGTVRDSLGAFCTELNVTCHDGVEIEAVFVSMGDVEAEHADEKRQVRHSGLFEFRRRDRVPKRHAIA